MIRLNIELLKGVNDICFGEFKNVVREKIGLNYKEPENHLDEPEVKKMLQGFKLMMVDIIGNHGDLQLFLRSESLAIPG